MVRPLGGGSFFKYRLVVSTKLQKSSRSTVILAHTFPKAHFSLSVMYNREVLFKINKALQQKFASYTFQRKSCNATVKLTRQSNSTKSTFQLNPSRAIIWINSKKELLRVAKGCHNRNNGSFKRLKVKLAIDYIKTIKQQAARVPARSSIITQLAL